MPPVLIGAALAAVVVVTALAVLRQLGPQPQPVKAEVPVRKLRRDPVTGEYRPF